MTVFYAALPIAAGFGLLFSALGKAARPSQAKNFFAEALSITSRTSLSIVAIYSAVVAELALAGALLANPVGLRGAALIFLSALLTLYGVLILRAHIAGVQTDCGCHGILGSERPSIRAVIWRAAGALMLLILAAHHGLNPLRSDASTVYWLALIIPYVAASALLCWAIVVSRGSALLRFHVLTKSALQQINSIRKPVL